MRHARKNTADACLHCSERGGRAFPQDFTMAFQPIVSIADGSVFAQEALVRGPAGEGALSILSQVTDENRYNFDQRCRVKAIEMAARLGIGEKVSINFLPNAVYNPEACIQKTLWAADRVDFPLNNIVFEFTEVEKISDVEHVKRIVAEYKRCGFLTAIDDFGAGYSGLDLFVELNPDIIKVDRELIRGIDQDRSRRATVRGLVGICAELGVTLIVEGVETTDERDALADLGVDLMQGFLFARPAFEALAEIRNLPAATRAA